MSWDTWLGVSIYADTSSLQSCSDNVKTLAIVDNFEWTSAYAERFGVVHIDYPSFPATRGGVAGIGNGTLNRTPKDSASFLSNYFANYTCMCQIPLFRMVALPITLPALLLTVHTQGERKLHPYRLSINSRAY